MMMIVHEFSEEAKNDFTLLRSPLPETSRPEVQFEQVPRGSGNL